MTAATAFKAARPSFGPMVVPLLALAVFVNYIDRGNLATAAPLLKDELRLTGTQLGVLTSAFFWTYTPTQILAGWLVERVNPYRTLAIGLGIWALATFLTGFATGFVTLLALRLLLGIGESAAFPSSSKLIAQHVHGHRLGYANSLLSLGVSVGPAVGVFFGGLLMTQVGWRGAFLLFGAASLAWLIPWTLTTRRLSGDADRVDLRPAPSFLAITRRPELWAVCWGHIAQAYGFYFVISWLPLYLVKERGYSVPQMATMGGVLYLVYGGAALLSGLATDRWIASGASPNLARKTAAMVGFVGGAASLLACAFADTGLTMTALFAAVLTLGVLSPHVFAISQTIAGGRGAGKWVAIQNSFGSLSGIAGPIITGAIIDRTGGFQVAFIVAAGVTLTGVLGWCLLLRKIEPLDWGQL